MLRLLRSMVTIFFEIVKKKFVQVLLLHSKVQKLQPLCVMSA